jgi:hypothetical protein
MADFLDQIKDFSENSPEAVNMDNLKPEKIGDITQQLPTEMIVESANPQIKQVEKPIANQNVDNDDMIGFFEEYNKNPVNKSVHPANLVKESKTAVSYEITKEDVDKITQAIINSIGKDKSIKNFIKDVVEESVSEVVNEILEDYFEEDDYYD